MNSKEIILKAADILEKPGAWTQGVFARDADGNQLILNDSTWEGEYYVSAGPPVCLCLTGALLEASKSYEKAYRAEVDIANLMDIQPVSFNDNPDRTQTQVVNILRGAANKI